MNLPKISIQIPSYNSAPYIKECIDSVLNLDYPYLDIHFLDDCSSDHTQDIVENYSSKNIIFHRNIENLGRVRNYQLGFSHRGNADWYINLDSDDYYTDHSWILKSMEILVKNPNENIVHIQANLLEYIDISDIRPIRDFGNGFYLLSGKDYVQICIKKYCFSHLGSIFHAQMTADSGAYTDDSMNTDFMTAARVAVRGNVLIGNIHLGHWREHNENQSSQRYSPKNARKNEVAFYKLFEYCEDFLPYKSIKSIISSYENRELEHKIYTLATDRNFAELSRTLIEEKKFNFSLIWIIMRGLFLKKSNALSQIASSLSHISSGILTKILSVCISFMIVPFIVQKLGIESYGIIGFYTTLIGSIYIFDFGLTNFISKELAEKKENASYSIAQKFGTIELIYSCIGIVIFGIIAMLSDFISHQWLDSDYFSSPIVLLIAFAVLAQWPHSFYTSSLFGLGHQHRANFIFLSAHLIKNLGIFIVFNYYQADIQTYFYWQIAVSIFLTFILRVSISMKMNQWIFFLDFSKSYLSSIQKFIIGISTISVFCFVYNDIANLLIAKWLPPVSYGQYSILWTIAAAYLMVGVSIKNAVLPSISKEDKAKSSDLFLLYSKIFTVIFLPGSIFLTLNSHFFLSMWLKLELISSLFQTSFIWIVLGSLCNVLTILPWIYLFVNTKNRFLIYLTGILAIISIPFLYFIIDLYGLVGASFFWFLINFIPYICIHVYVFNLHKLSFIDSMKVFTKPFLISAIGSLISIFLIDAISNLYLRIIFAIIFIIHLYLTVTYFSFYKK